MNEGLTRLMRERLPTEEGQASPRRGSLRFLQPRAELTLFADDFENHSPLEGETRLRKEGFPIDE